MKFGLLAFRKFSVPFRLFEMSPLHIKMNLHAPLFGGQLIFYCKVLCIMCSDKEIHKDINVPNKVFKILKCGFI
jgi:hypothetical protein